MRKNVYGYQLSRTKNQRTALFKGLVSSLVEKGEMTTTLTKARAIKPMAERLITKAKKGDLNSRRQIHRVLGKTQLVNRLCDVIAPVFKDKNGGYLRLVKIGSRTGDGALMVKVMFTQDLPVETPKTKAETRPSDKKKGKEEVK